MFPTLQGGHRFCVIPERLAVAFNLDDEGINKEGPQSTSASATICRGGKGRTLRPGTPQKLRSVYSCRKIFKRVLCTRISPLYSTKPSFRKRFIKKLTRDRVVPIISADWKSV